MKKLNSCPVCSGGYFSSLLMCNDYSTSKEDFTIVSCNSCDFTFTNPRPADKNLEKYYLSDKYISHTNTSKGLFEKLYHIVREYAIGQKIKFIK